MQHFAQRRVRAEAQFVFSAHWIMLRDILRFFRRAPDVLGSARDPSLGQMINELQVGAHARDKFLIPMGAAIWSMPPGQILDMPAKTSVGFFQVHNLLSASGHHAWRTVAGGSRVYVEALSRLLTSGFALMFAVGRRPKRRAAGVRPSRSYHRRWRA